MRSNQGWSSSRVLVFLLCIGSFGFGYIVGVNHTRRAAIESGVAKWTRGVEGAEFHWISRKENVHATQD
jgi:hypothetical protein